MNLISEVFLVERYEILQALHATSPFTASSFLTKISHRATLSEIPRLVKDMVSVAPDTLALEKRREAQVLRYLVFRNDIVSTLRLTDDKLADLQIYISIMLLYMISDNGTHT